MGYPGVWTRQDKIGAVGIAVKRWVTFPGVSLNVSPRIVDFLFIVPCGPTHMKVISLSQILKREVDLGGAMICLRDSFDYNFRLRFTELHET